MRLPVAGVVSVSAVIQVTLRPSTPPLALTSSIAIWIPRRSSWPLLPYWPLASQVRPSLIGFAALCAQTRFSFQGPKKLPVPPMTLAIRLPFNTPRRDIPRFFIASSQRLFAGLFSFLLRDLE